MSKDANRMVDKINPDYYKEKPIEIIDCIGSICHGKSGIEAFLVGQVVKYVARYDQKNGIEDIKKAKWYLEKLEKVLSQGSVSNGEN